LPNRLFLGKIICDSIGGMIMENISQMSLLEVAVMLMEQKKAPQSIRTLIKEVLEMKGLEDVDLSLSTQLYIDITTSSKFVYMGNEEWDLKSRQSLDEYDKDGSAFNSKEDLEEDLEEDIEELEEIVDEDEDDDDYLDDDDDEDDDDYLDDDDDDEDEDDDDLDDDEDGDIDLDLDDDDFDDDFDDDEEDDDDEDIEDDDDDL
jgi:DNA-directed RNA polymerase subunit delta